VVQDTAGFVNRGLAILWREAVDSDLVAHIDVASDYDQARLLIERDDLASLGRLLHAHPALLDYRPPQGDGYQLLHVAACRGSVPCIGLLIEHGAPLDALSGHAQADEEGFRPGATPLLIAAEAAREDFAMELLAAGANANACLPSGRETALQMAAARGLDRLVEALINAGADLEAQATWHSYDDQLGSFSGNGALHAAALNNHPELVRLLLKAGAQRDGCGTDLRTPLHYAAARGCVEAVEVLLAAGADPDALDSCSLESLSTRLSPLHYAVINDHATTVAMLLCYGADPALVEAGSGESALQMAERSENPQLGALLARAQRGEAGEGVFSHLDDQYIVCLPASYVELRAFLLSLLSEFPVGSKSLLVLSDWLAEMLGAENRPHLVRAYRESLAGGAH
jgi:ankyrin repeat protein